MIDTHCHLTSEVFAGREDEVVAAARAAGVRGVITVAVTAADSVRARALAERLPGVWCTAGMHPLYAGEPQDWGEIRIAGEHPRCLAWGELGLDNHYEKPPRALQDEVLALQLAMIEAAREDGVELPIILHCRDAFDELIAVLRAAHVRADRCVFHCFTGGPAEARRVLDFGAWISFTGVVTFANAREVAEAAAIVPADRIMVETDAPYLTPEPHRKVRPNEPRFVVHTARRLAQLRGAEPAAFEEILDANAERFFGRALRETE
jgi:TatD DNase family protein